MRKLHLHSIRAAEAVAHVRGGVRAAQTKDPWPDIPPATPTPDPTPTPVPTDDKKDDEKKDD